MKIKLDRPNMQEMELNASQNFFYSKKTRKKFINGSLTLYLISYIPALTLTFLVYKNTSFKKYIKEQNTFIIICSILTISLSFGLSYSKILARKFPLNYFLYFLYIFCFAFVIAGIAEEYSKIKMLAFICIFFSQAFGMFIYGRVGSERFLMKFGLFYSTAFVLISFLGLVFAFGASFREIGAFSVLGILVSGFILYAMESVVKNKGFLMLPDDYIMGCMKMCALLPLLENISEE